MKKDKKDKCRVCKQPVRIQIFKGTRLCSVNCQKSYQAEQEKK